MIKPTYNQILGTATVLLAGFALWTFYDRLKADLPVNVSVQLPQAKETVKETQKVVEVRYVKVFDDSTKVDLGLPKDVQDNPDKKVLVTGKLNAEERPYTLTATIDTKTGEGAVFARADPLPWIGPGTQGKIGLAYGSKNGQQVGRFYAAHDLVQVKSLHAGLIGTIDTDSEYFAGGYVEWRF